MHAAEVNPRLAPRALRLWPGVVAVTLQWLLRFGLPFVAPDAAFFAVIGGIVGGLAVLVWWMFFSRIPHLDRWGAVALIAAAGLAAPRTILHPSIATGMMGMMFPIYAAPVISLALVAWAVLAGRSLDTAGSRRLALAGFILAACAIFALLRTDGIIGDAGSQLAWRWTKTPEEQLLARTIAEPAPVVAVPAPTPPVPATSGPPAAKQEPTEPPPPVAKTTPPPPPPPPASIAAAVWPGFRGPHRDGVVRGLSINTDWAASPPVVLWRRPIGPGWSSIAVGAGGDLLYTQEQRGEFEVVSCYKSATGEPVWTHRDSTRFWESNAGAGPRSTPTLSGSRVYALGATGILNALNAADGALVWSRNVATDTGAKVPGWGFASSPLVVGDSVIVAAASRLAAYRANTGEPLWVVQTGGGSYSSPHLLNIDGTSQVVLLSSPGATAVSPADGKVLWKHEWKGGGLTMLQPTQVAPGSADLLITTGGDAGGLGTRRLSIAHGQDGNWTAEERWTSTGLKPYFNDLVVHKGHAYGFDGTILSCIDLEDSGRRKWKGGRYGHGQMLLLADQDLLLVLSEEGELALVAAGATQFTELARIPALEGKTWNHPVIAGDTLLIRNGQEMAAFRLR